MIVIFKCENADTNKRPNYKNKPVQHELLAVKLFMVLVYQMNFSRAVAAEKMYPTPWMDAFDAYSLVKATRETLSLEGFIVTVCSFA